MEEITDKVENFRKDFKILWTDTKEGFSYLSHDVKELKSSKIPENRWRRQRRDCEERETILWGIINHLLRNQKDITNTMDYLESKSRQISIRIFSVKEVT